LSVERCNQLAPHEMREGRRHSAGRTGNSKQHRERARRESKLRMGTEPRRRRSQPRSRHENRHATEQYADRNHAVSSLIPPGTPANKRPQWVILVQGVVGARVGRIHRRRPYDDPQRRSSADTRYAKRGPPRSVVKLASRWRCGRKDRIITADEMKFALPVVGRGAVPNPV